MKFIQTLLALALAGSMGSAVAVTPGDLGNLSGQTVSIGNTISAGHFDDVYLFDIMPESVAVGTTVTINLDIPLFSGTEFELSNMMIKFTDFSGATIFASDTQTGPLDTTLQILATLPAALDYKFVVSGDVSGTLGGSYGGVLQAVPVPEAETYAMLLVGIGLIGLRLRSRIGTGRRIYA